MVFWDVGKHTFFLVCVLDTSDVDFLFVQLELLFCVLDSTTIAFGLPPAADWEPAGCDPASDWFPFGCELPPADWDPPACEVPATLILVHVDLLCPGKWHLLHLIIVPILGILVAFLTSVGSLLLSFGLPGIFT